MNRPTQAEFEEARQYAGPKAGTCKSCGEIIEAYVTRWYGPTGAVHAHPPCSFGPSDLYPLHYTDG